MTIPEEVNAINYDRMIKLCTEGRVKYIIKPSEEKRKQEDIVNLMKIYDRP